MQGATFSTPYLTRMFSVPFKLNNRTKPFKFFTGCSIEKEEYSYYSYTRPNSLFAHHEVLIWTAHDMYELRIPWLCAGGFKKKLKLLLK